MSTFARLTSLTVMTSMLAATAGLAHARGSTAADAASPGSSASADWPDLDLHAAPTYFPADATIMVVGVGADAAPVATALLAAIDGALDAAALGDVSRQADDTIVERALKMTATRVAVVRVFGAGAKAKAVVTVYGAPGQVTAAFTVAPGKTLGDNPTPESAGEGVRRDELTSVEKTSRPTQARAGGDDDGDDAPDHPDAISFERNALVTVSQYGMHTYDQATFFFHGAPIQDTPALYDAMGRHEEASTFRAQRDKWKTRAVVGGFLGVVGGVGVLSFGLYALLANSGYDAEYNPTRRDTTTPWLLTAASGAVIITGYLVSNSVKRPQELSPDEAISQVRTYNRGLGRSALLTPRHRTPLLERVAVAPTASPSGGGLVVAGSF